MAAITGEIKIPSEEAQLLVLFKRKIIQVSKKSLIDKMFFHEDQYWKKLLSSGDLSKEVPSFLAAIDALTKNESISTEAEFAKAINVHALNAILNQLPNCDHMRGNNPTFYDSLNRFLERVRLILNYQDHLASNLDKDFFRAAGILSLKFCNPDEILMAEIRNLATKGGKTLAVKWMPLYSTGISHVNFICDHILAHRIFRTLGDYDMLSMDIDRCLYWMAEDSNVMFSSFPRLFKECFKLHRQALQSFMDNDFNQKAGEPHTLDLSLVVSETVFGEEGQRRRRQQKALVELNKTLSNLDEVDARAILRLALEMVVLRGATKPEDRAALTVLPPGARSLPVEPASPSPTVTFSHQPLQRTAGPGVAYAEAASIGAGGDPGAVIKPKNSG